MIEKSTETTESAGRKNRWDQNGMQPSAAREVNIQGTEPLISPIELVNRLPMTSAVERTVTSGRAQTRDILNGVDSRFMVIVGPCSIHDEVVAFDYAERPAGLRSRLLVDFSHGNAIQDHAGQSSALKNVVNQRLAGNGDIVGCMMESNINPGKQLLGDDPSRLAYGVSITDACMGWQETEELLTWMYRKMADATKALLSQRPPNSE